ncbi:hypothetical protein [Clostridium sporogenes]|uniref:hypothetical protein n=1 Tax=Clostridium sporogenes TaxID=1509 RepID=UPI0013CFA9E6|nr:hypothetical protein [Clostridium sporogenes]NFH40786.1 hypothetical protein [Clostridium sporogenes]
MDKDTILKIYEILKKENQSRKEDIYEYMNDEDCSIERLKEMQLKNCGIGIAKDIVKDIYNKVCLMEEIE